MKTFCKPYITRLAPSPTGELHLGNIWAFLMAWLAARASGGKIYLRMDDIDPARSKRAHAEKIIETLAWLGLDWDDEILWQSARYSRYGQALREIEARAHVYPCFCTRKDLRSMASAPHLGESGFFYPGTCSRLASAEKRQLMQAGTPFSLRLCCKGQTIRFEDLIQGQQQYSHKEYGGDFPLRRSDGVWSYQLASVIDDIDHGINLVIRGRDLLFSTPRQIIIYQLFGQPLPAYAHVPLLLDSQGERLAKRHRSLSIARLKMENVSAPAIIGYLGFLANLNPGSRSCMPRDLLPAFSLEKLPCLDMRVPMGNGVIGKRMDAEGKAKANIDPWPASG